MKVTHVIQGLGLGGAESFVIALARAQLALGAQVDIVLVGSDFVEAPDGLDVTALRGSARKDPACVLRVRAHLRDQGTDIAHLHTFSGLVYGGIGAAAAHTTRIFTEHASSSPVRFYGRMQRLADFMAQRSSRVITFDDELRKIIIERSRLDPTRVVVIPNGIEVLHEPSMSREEAREDLEVAGSSPVVVAVGGLRPQKDYAMLLEVIMKFANDPSAVQPEFRIIGEGSERSMLQSVIAENSLRNVRFLGSRRNVRDLLVGADVFVNTSTWEGMPIAILEAMAAGLPIVATSSGSLPELIGEAGILTTRDADELHLAIRSVISDPARATALGQESRSRVSDRFDISVIAAKHLKLYDEVLQSQQTHGWRRA